MFSLGEVVERFPRSHSERPAPPTGIPRPRRSFGCPLATPDLGCRFGPAHWPRDLCARTVSASGFARRGSRSGDGPVGYG